MSQTAESIAIYLIPSNRRVREVRVYLERVFRCLSICIAVLVWGCTDQGSSSEEVVVRLAVLESCENDVLREIQNIPEREPWTGAFRSFDSPLRTHPDVSGFIEVRVDRNNPVWRRLMQDDDRTDRELLTLFANGFRTACFTDHQNSYEIDTASDVDDLFRFLYLSERGALSYEEDGELVRPDLERAYLIYEDGQIELHFQVE